MNVHEFALEKVQTWGHSNYSGHFSWMAAHILNMYFIITTHSLQDKCLVFLQPYYSFTFLTNEQSFWPLEGGHDLCMIAHLHQMQMINTLHAPNYLRQHTQRGKNMNTGKASHDFKQGEWIRFCFKKKKKSVVSVTHYYTCDLDGIHLTWVHNTITLSQNKPRARWETGIFINLLRGKSTYKIFFSHAKQCLELICSDE